MKHYLLKVICLFSFFIWSGLATAQKQTIKVIGTLVEEETSQPVPYATVALYTTTTKELITGITSNEEGKFSIPTTSTDFYVVISFMGYQTKTVTEFSISKGSANLGTISLAPDTKMLDAIVVEGETSKTTFELDKRVFNVGKDLSTTGASALEVLNNVPSVNVNIEGEVSLRGSAGVQILINGKPSILADESGNALGTITADMIEKIEVITNPSAKYEASGTSGILNIVLKKDSKKGWNGSISVNTGIPDNHSIGGSINRRTEKFNLFTQFGAGYRSRPRQSETISQNLLNGQTILSDGEEFRNETFFNIRLGTDYHFNKYNIFTLSGNFAYEIEDQPSETDFTFLENEQLVSQWMRNEDTEATNPKWQYELNWTKTFKNNEDHTFQISALGSSFGKDLTSKFVDTTLEGENVDTNQLTATNFEQTNYTFKADYVHPISDSYTLETGALYVMSDVGNNFEVQDFIDGEYVDNLEFTNNFEWNQNVLGVYATAAFETKIWGLKAGLRVENTDLQTLLTNTNEKNSQNFTNFFPSLHTSYKAAENFSIQAGYSRRIFRPRLWDLNPFFSIRNNFNIRTGNPNLQPEFTDSYEITSIYEIGDASLSSSIYHRYTTDVVERVSTFTDNVTFTTPQNIGTNSLFGFETNGKYTPVKWITFNGNFNYTYFQREGVFESQNFDFTGTQWSARLDAKIKLPADIDLELAGNYRSNVETVQGKQSGFAFMDIGLRKKIIKGKIVASLGIRDVFASRIQEIFVNQATFETYNFAQRGRFITFGISYAFGKGEAMSYSGSRRR
ncbi:outer membrane receptor for ferrienterochelin and colicins [Bernardetia litoralis DSM 6794]|uniref:Outer membrane receptor for ferrienterochelin and colicins n=1 Tax=Bernardetia litoralis (strain ATCC 23117 / DSM 6794 / NBRC 15988 / NCIMB 1366 / Fx l1 / Sio-4) TaxID=880071 RepID=I4AIF1_BERLS|nr:outer membrane beta-barrel family protein [Bernardetia litoralis]AFM03736.1 outer membrane receptor for ferrienterochelin and colicins [Bernardetia litoralis DSM 6794]